MNVSGTRGWIQPVALALVAWSTTAAAQVVDTSLWVPNGDVLAIARDGSTIYIGVRSMDISGGTVFIGGQFTVCGG